MFNDVTLRTQEDRALASQIANYVERHNLSRDGKAILTSSSLLLPAGNPNGDKLMLKAVRPNHIELDAPIMYRMYNGNGAARLFDQEDNLHILERAVSDHEPLWHMAINGRDQEAALIACDITKKLHESQWHEALTTSMRTYKDRNLSVELRLKEQVVPGHLIESFKAALALQPQLSSEYPARPLHSDLHYWNIVHDERRGWLAIDPQGWMGPEPAAMANTVTNPHDPMFKTDPAFVLNKARMTKQIQRISEAMSWDRDDLTKFVFVHAVQVASRRMNQPNNPNIVGTEYWVEAARLAADIGKIPTGQKNNVFMSDMPSLLKPQPKA